MFIKIIFKDSKKVKRIKNYVSKCNTYLYFLMQQNLLIFGEKMMMSAEFKGCVTWFICCLDLLEVKYNCAKFHHCRVNVTDFRKGGPFYPLHPWVAPKRSILKRSLNIDTFLIASVIHYQGPSWKGLSNFFLIFLLDFSLKTSQNQTFSLHKICENTYFHWPVFSRIRPKSQISSLYGRIRVSENPYSRIFYVVFLMISWVIKREHWEEMG